MTQSPLLFLALMLIIPEALFPRNYPNRLAKGKNVKKAVKKRRGTEKKALTKTAV
ncbi:MAG: hypothetical protein IJP78_05215 [Clostridia bacterium]|nr:hypothetical protein [Clostridia bacterium]